MENCNMIIKVAGIPISLTSLYPFQRVNFRKSMQDFLFISNNIKAAVNIHAHYGKVPKINFRDKYLIYEVEKVWSLYKQNGKYIFNHQRIEYGRKPFLIRYVNYRNKNFNLPRSHIYDLKLLKEELPLPYRLAIFEHNFRKGNVYVRFSPQDRSFSLPNPLAHNLLELIILSLLYLRRFGALFHACGIAEGKQGYLFLGTSGCGKSTMAKLWQNYSLILHDDRIIVRKIQGHFWIFGTPWHSKLGLIKNQGVPLRKIFFLKHGSKNRAVKLTPAEALSRLLIHSTPPIWYNNKIIEYNIEICSELAEELPCYSLEFIPGKRIIDFIKEIE